MPHAHQLEVEYTTACDSGRRLTLAHGIPGRVPNCVANLDEREVKSASLFVRPLMK